MNFGVFAGPHEAFAIMDRAIEVGLNFFDTADAYPPKWASAMVGRDVPLGTTENIIGRWFAQGGRRRDHVVLATKVYSDMGDWPNERGLSALNIKRACEASLRRLQTDYIDVYQMHHVDRETPWDEIWEGMELLRRQGKILYVGSSNFAGWHIAQAQEAAMRHNAFGLVSEQSIYNLLVRDVEREVLPAAEAYGIGVVAWSPLQGGLLGGVARKEREGRRRLEGRAKRTLEAKRDQVEAYEAFCGELGVQPGTVALSWLLARPALVAPVIGPRGPDQLESALAALEVELDSQALARLDEIFPAYRCAPEDYAW